VYEISRISKSRDRRWTGGCQGLGEEEMGRNCLMGLRSSKRTQLRGVGWSALEMVFRESCLLKPDMNFAY